MFTVRVAIELYGMKVNLELTFPAHPSLLELTRQVEHVFSLESATLRPEGKATQMIRIQKFFMYSPSIDEWTELTNATHMVEGCQIYGFQRDIIGSQDTQQVIPPARLPKHVVESRRNDHHPHLTTSPPQPTTTTSTTTTDTLTSPQRTTPSRNPLFTTPSSSGGTLPLTIVHPYTGVTEDKIRALYDFALHHGNHNGSTSRGAAAALGIDYEVWKRLLRVLQVDISPELSSELFTRADSNTEGVLRYSDFYNFCVTFPAFSECLHVHLRDYTEEEAASIEIKKLREEISELERIERASSEQTTICQQNVHLQERRVAATDVEVQDRKEQEKRILAQLNEARRGTERMHRERAQRESECAISKEQERAKALAHDDALREIERIEKRLQQQEQEFLKSQEREKALYLQYLEAQKETENLHRVLQGVHAEVGTAREREHVLTLQVAEAQRVVQRSQEKISNSDVEINLSVKKEKEIESLFKEAEKDTTRTNGRKEDEGRELRMLMEHLNEAERSHETAARTVEDRLRKLKAFENERDFAHHRRSLTRQKERSLLEEELRIKLQRDALDVKEAQLQRDVTSLLDVVSAHNSLSNHNSNNSLSNPNTNTNTRMAMPMRHRSSVSDILLSSSSQSASNSPHRRNTTSSSTSRAILFANQNNNNPPSSPLSGASGSPVRSYGISVPIRMSNNAYQQQ
eukprot:PhF_6_TR5556/c0_g1_i1/m.7932